MEMFTTEVTIWLALGVTLIILEVFIPGAILSFIGIASIIIGTCVHYGLITSIIHALCYWMILSLFLVLFLRSFFLKFLPGDWEVGASDEDSEMIGTVVKVVEEIKAYSEGRVRYLDSTWVAIGDSDFNIDDEVVIEGREGNKLIIGKIN